MNEETTKGPREDSINKYKYTTSESGYMHQLSIIISWTTTATTTTTVRFWSGCTTPRAS